MTSPAGPVGVISNPGSGHNRDQFGGIRARIDSTPGVHHLVTASVQDIDPALEALADRGVRVLAINGGDGTASAILGRLLERGMFDEPPLIALLPGGTANMNAGDIGIRGSLQKAVERFCQWCEGAPPTDTQTASRALLRVTLSGSSCPHYGMFLGAGAVIQGTEYAHEEIHSRGLRDDFSLALGVLRTVWGVLRDDPAFNRHVTVSIGLDDAPATSHDALILVISTLQRLAFGMRPFWAEGPGDVRLTLFEQGCTRFARTFISIVRGKPGRNAVPASGYQSHNAAAIHLELSGKLNLDGEIIEAVGTVEVAATRRLEFLQL